jgi:hypothetical protein
MVNLPAKQVPIEVISKATTLLDFMEIELTEYEKALINMALRSQAVVELTKATKGDAEALERGQAYSALAEKVSAAS